MELPVKQEQGRYIITLPSELDVKSIGDFEQGVVLSLPPEGVINVILDFSDTHYIDSAAIGGIVRLFRRFKDRKGSLVVASCRENVRKILKLINLQRYIQLFESVADALAAEVK